MNSGLLGTAGLLIAVNYPLIDIGQGTAATTIGVAG